MPDPDKPPPFVTDPAGGPMLWLPGVGAYVHLLPVSKIQFETFVCARPSSQFDQQWYDKLLTLDKEKGSTGRVSPHAVTAANYWQAFVTGIRPTEAAVYATWCEESTGATFELPTADRWWKAFQELDDAAKAEPKLFARALDALGTAVPPRLRELLAKVDARSPADGRTRADTMLLRHGVMEWVRLPGRPEWGGFGNPSPALLAEMHNSLTQQRARPRPEAATERSIAYGFRLFREKSS